MKIYKVKVNGKVYEVELESVSESEGKVEAKEVKEEVKQEVKATPSGEGTLLKAPLQGTILKINVNVGDKVKKGQAVIILEAMKLENEVVAPCDGVVKEIKVSKGQSVNNQDALLIIG